MVRVNFNEATFDKATVYCFQKNHDGIPQTESHEIYGKKAVALRMALEWEAKIKKGICSVSRGQEAKHHWITVYRHA